MTIKLVVRLAAGHTAYFGRTAAKPAEKTIFRQIDGQAETIMALWTPGQGIFLIMGTSNSVDPIDGRAPLQEAPMVDRLSLEILGFMLGGATALVIAIAVLAVRSQITTNVVLEQAAPVVPAALSPPR